MLPADQASVLVIDNDQTIREVLNDSLAEDGFMVESAPNAEEALVKVRKTPYDAIVTDLNLPGLKGTDVVRQALKIYPDTVIVVICLDSQSPQWGQTDLDMPALGLGWDDTVEVVDELSGEVYRWGQRNAVGLDPHWRTAHILRVVRR